MGLLTAFEKRILELRVRDLSDYAIARHLDKDPPTIYKSRKNAHRKLREAKKDLEWAKQLGVHQKLDNKPKKEPTPRETF